MRLLRTYIKRRASDPFASSQVSDPEELDLLKPSSEFRPKELAIDDVKRIIIPAFPATRASKSHLHTAVETNWVEALKDYPIDEEIQDDVSARGHSSSFDPWLTRDNYRYTLSFALRRRSGLSTSHISRLASLAYTTC